jgi:hypothetical protein
MNEAAMIMSGMAVCFTLITAVFSVLAYAKVVGMEKSTHRIVQQYVPLEDGEVGPSGEDLVKRMQKAFYPEEEGHV